ncbi:MAG: sigma 54-interacting transcriptional regulator [Nitrospirae bacterium]|nr:sigma 54-interacting transcriptional regulator [Nitrospirota bacterium]
MRSIGSNCAALPPTLIESELFGRGKGAFTGALSKQLGLFELADESTIFLDEIDSLPLELQAKHLCSTRYTLDVGAGERAHERRVHPHTSGYRNRCGPDQNNSGQKSSVNDLAYLKFS